MEINLKDKVLIARSEYENMLELLLRANNVMCKACTKTGEKLVDFDNRDEGTQLFCDISDVIKMWDEDSPIKFITQGGK